MDLPFDKIGIAHLARSLIAPNGLWHEVLDGVTDAQYIDMFQKVARCGAGVEIRADDFAFSQKTPEEVHRVLRIFDLLRSAVAGSISAVMPTIRASCVPPTPSMRTRYGNLH